MLCRAGFQPAICQIAGRCQAESPTCFGIAPKNKPLPKQIQTQAEDQHAGKDFEKWNDGSRQDVFRCRQGDDAEQKDRAGMRQCDDGAEHDGVPGRSARADEVGGDHRLAVTGRQRVERSQRESDK